MNIRETNRAIGVFLEGAPKDYARYIEIRNGYFAQQIAAIIGGEYIGKVTPGGDFPKNTMVVPAVPMTRRQKEALKVDKVYGVVADELDQLGKAMLHVSESKDLPAFYTPEFAERVKGVVLPGIVGFREQDLLSFYVSNPHDRYSLRLKLTNETDAQGQEAINNLEHLQELLSSMNPREIADRGVVLEAEVINPKTISVGEMELGGQKYSFIAYQKNETVEEMDSMTGKAHLRNRFMGAHVIVVNGDLQTLANYPIGHEESKQAISAASIFLSEYRKLGYEITRISVDYLYGTDLQGNFMGGITDITGRPGGFCAALFEAVKEFTQDGSKKITLAESTLNYNRTIKLEEEKPENGAKVVMDHPNLLITARRRPDFISPVQVNRQG